MKVSPHSLVATPVLPVPLVACDQLVFPQPSDPMETPCSVLLLQPCVPGSRGPKASSLSTHCHGSALRCWPCPGPEGLTV